MLAGLLHFFSETLARNANKSDRHTSMIISWRLETFCSAQHTLANDAAEKASAEAAQLSWEKLSGEDLVQRAAL